jgi:hypothetical protein
MDGMEWMKTVTVSRGGEDEFIWMSRPKPSTLLVSLRVSDDDGKGTH